MPPEKRIDILDAIEIMKDCDFEPIGSLKEILFIVEELEADISPVVEAEYADQTNVQRRAAVRAVFALIEGLAYRLKQVAMELDTVLDRRLTEHERMMIVEETCRVTQTGVVELQSAHISASSNIRFAFNVLKKVTNSEHHLDVDGVGWNEYRKSIAVRDRITHPKKREDLQVLEPEMASLKEANLWFLRELAAALTYTIRGLMHMRPETIPSKRP